MLMFQDSNVTYVPPTSFPMHYESSDEVYTMQNFLVPSWTTRMAVHGRRLLQA